MTRTEDEAAVDERAADWSGAPHAASTAGVRAGVAPEPPNYSWLSVRWPEWARRAIVLQLVVAGAAQALIAAVDLRYFAVDVAGALTVLWWLAGALACLVVVVALTKRCAWFPLPLLVAQTMIALGSLYVLWAESTSSYTDLGLLLFALALLATALVVALPLTFTLASIPGRLWAGVLALVSTLGITQFTVENWWMPHRARPQIQVTAVLEEVGRSAHVSHVRGTIKIANAGRAPAAIPMAFAVLTATGDGGEPHAEPDVAGVTSTLSPLRQDNRPYARSLPPGAGSAAIWLEDLSAVEDVLPAGQSYTREFSVDVDRSQVRRLDLRVDTASLTSVRYDTPRTCDEAHVAHDAEDFTTAVRKAVVSQGYTYYCVKLPVRPRNAVRHVTLDHPNIVLGYMFEAPQPQPEYEGPFIHYASKEDSLEDPASLRRAGERFDRLTPSLVLMTTASLPLPNDGAPFEGR